MSESPRFHRTVQWAVLALAGVYAAWFGVFTCIQHLRFKTYAFDLGTFDQGIWLAGHGTDYFVTVRGLPLLGDHVRLFSFVLAPVYWIVDDVRALLVLQSVAIAAGAFFLCRIALRLVPSRPFLALALSAGFLLHPANQNLNIDHAHPDAFAMTFLLASVDFLGAGRLLAFTVAAALAMSCKEDVPLVFAALGAAMMLDRRRRGLGFVIAAVASAYFLLCMVVILPWLNGAGFFRLGEQGFLAGLWAEGGNPAWLLERLTRPESAAYLLQIGAAHLYLFFLAPLAVIPAIPAIGANLLSDAYYMRSLEFHYQTSVVPFLAIGTIHGVAFLERVRGRLAESGAGMPAGFARRAGARTLGLLLLIAPAALLTSAIAANIEWSRLPIRYPRILFQNWSLLTEDRANSYAREVFAQIPPDAVVAADYSSVPHLSHRRRIYMLPNPFEMSNWGVAGERRHNPDDVEYIVMRKVIHSNEPIEALVADLVEDGQFERIGGDGSIGLYRRIDVVRMHKTATCGDWNGDRKVTIEDQRQIGDAIIRGRACPLDVCDTNGNGKVEYLDVLIVGRLANDPTARLSCPPAGREVD